MTFGFKAINDDSVVQVDDTYKVMQLVGQGVATPGTSIYFPRVCRSVEPPWIFMRPLDGGWFLGLSFIGSPGAWSGFRFHACASVTFNHSLAGRLHGRWEYAVGEWAVQASDEYYGMRLWDENGRLLWDAGVRYMKLQQPFRTFYRASLGYGHGYALDLEPAASLADPNNFLLMNPYANEQNRSPSGYFVCRKVGGFGTSQVLIAIESGGDGNPYLSSYVAPSFIGRISA